MEHRYQLRGLAVPTTPNRHAAQVDAANRQLAQFGTDIGTVAAGLALIAAGILPGALIYDNCSPEGGSSVKDLELKGSSGKTYAGSSKEEKATEAGFPRKSKPLRVR